MVELLLAAAVAAVVALVAWWRLAWVRKPTREWKYQLGTRLGGPPSRSRRVYITIDGHAALLFGYDGETVGAVLDAVLRGPQRGPRRAWRLHDEALRPVPETTKFFELPDDVHLFTHTFDS